MYRAWLLLFPLTIPAEVSLEIPLTVPLEDHLTFPLGVPLKIRKDFIDSKTAYVQTTWYFQGPSAQIERHYVRIQTACIPQRVDYNSDHQAHVSQPYSLMRYPLQKTLD